MEDKIKYVECLSCGSKNKIHFCISKDDDYTLDKIVDHKGRIIYNNGNVGDKLININEYDIFLCECHGVCNDEMSSSDVKITLSDNTIIVGETKVWEYIKNNTNGR